MPEFIDLAAALSATNKLPALSKVRPVRYDDALVKAAKVLRVPFVVNSKTLRLGVSATNKLLALSKAKLEYLLLIIRSRERCCALRRGKFIDHAVTVSLHKQVARAVKGQT